MSTSMLAPPTRNPPPQRIPHQDIIEEFRSIITESRWPHCDCETPAKGPCSKNKCHRNFVYTPNLRRWAKEAEDGQTNGQRLLNRLGITESLFVDPLESMLLVLSCLTEMRSEFLFAFFKTADVFDQKLEVPIPTGQKEEIIKEACKSGLRKEEVEEALMSFEQRRLAFIPEQIQNKAPNFFTTRLTEHEDRPLPFCDRSKVKDGGTATVHKVIVPAGLVDNDVSVHLRGASPFQRYGMCYDFAIKTYDEDQEAVFQKELNAFMGLTDITGIIRCFGSYKIKAQDGRKTSNLILEYSSMDLAVYYDSQPPPQRLETIISSWKMIFEVAAAIKSIHELSHENRSYVGWHGDVKPGNILLCSVNGQNCFKLADFGFAEFRSESGLPTPTVPMLGGTDTYGAPDPGDQKHQSIDIWSFGCVLYAHATWLTGGKPDLEAFDEMRRIALKTLSITDSDAFHDGENVLHEITAWHKYLVANGRHSDLIIDKVLTLVDTRMLQPHDARLDARELHEGLQQILEEAERAVHIHNEWPPAIAEALEQWNTREQEQLIKSYEELRHYPSNTYTRSRLKHGPQSAASSQSDSTMSARSSHNLTPPPTRTQTEGPIPPDSIHGPSAPRSTGNGERDNKVEPSRSDIKRFWERLRGNDADRIDRCRESLIRCHQLANLPDPENRHSGIPAMYISENYTSADRDLLKMLVERSNIKARDAAEHKNILHLLVASLRRTGFSAEEDGGQLQEIFRGKVADIINKKDIDRHPPIYYADCKKDIVELLVSLGATVKPWMLIFAIKNNELSCADYLVDKHKIGLGADDLTESWKYLDSHATRWLKSRGFRPGKVGILPK